MSKMTNQEYQAFYEEKIPKSPLWKNALKAFVVGGAICVLGQMIINYAISRGVNKEDAPVIASIVLVFLSALFTGLDLYDNLAKHAGAGTIVPITGFANAVVAPAIEFKSEGYVLGLAAKMFVIAGPVIVYGTITSVAAGILYYLIKAL